MSKGRVDDVCEDGACFTIPVDLDDGHPSVFPVQSVNLDDGSVTGQSTITLSLAEYENLQYKLKSKDRKLKALNNIHLLIREKDEELLSLKERHKNCQEALMLSELRHLKFLRLATKFPTQYTEARHAVASERDSRPEIDDQSVVFDAKNSLFHSLCLSDTGAGSMRAGETENQEEGKVEDLYERLPEDGTRENSLEADEAFTRCHEVLSDPMKDKSNTTMTESDFSSMSKMSSKCAESPQWDDPETQSMRLNLMPRGIQVQRRSAVSTKFPGISKDLTIKLMQQNTRLKIVLRKILSSRGTNIEEYLQRQEYADVVEQLRQEIRLLQLRVKSQEELLTSVRNSDVDTLARRSVQLEAMVLKQNRMLVVKQAMIDAFSKRCEELEDRVKHLKLSKTPKLSMPQSTPGTLVFGDRVTEHSGTSASSRTPPSPASSRAELATDAVADATDFQELIPRSSDSKTAPAPSGGSVASRSRFLVCERCDREFSETEMDRYTDHCTRCTDD